MYKIVNVSDLNIASEFIESDKLIQLSEDQTKMFVADNDYAHKNQSYLSNCINIADNALNSYMAAIDNIETTYITANVNDVYMKDGSLIQLDTFNRILSSDAFLTKEGCKKIETDCIAYINELKNKAVSIIMAQLNSSFIQQNSVGHLSYGQVAKNSGRAIDYTKDILKFELPDNNDYNFETGEFSFANLLFGRVDFELSDVESDNSETIGGVGDAWNDYYNDVAKSYFGNMSYDSIEDMIKAISYDLVFNAKTNADSNVDYKIHVPEASYDFVKNQSIPIAKLVEYFLKSQIKTVIKNICDKYISQMTSIPHFATTSSASN